MLTVRSRRDISIHAHAAHPTARCMERDGAIGSQQGTYGGRQGSSIAMRSMDLTLEDMTSEPRLPFEDVAFCFASRFCPDIGLRSRDDGLRGFCFRAFGCGRS